MLEKEFVVADQPIHPIVELTKAEAELILRQWLGEEVPCTSLRRLTGGCVNTVLEVHFEHERSPVILKLSHGAGYGEGEYRILEYYRTHTTFPVPEPHFYDASASLVPYSYLIMQRLPGENMGEAILWMTPRDRVRVERQIAEEVAELHTHTRERFGSFREEGTRETWAERFHRQVSDVYRENEALGLISSLRMRQIAQVLDRFDRIFDVPGKPTLVHGDIWATNIMVHRDGEGAALSGFLDASGRFAHTEYELAYLEIWNTVGDAFFEVYTQVHPLLEGYEVRRMVYWLNTLLVHVFCFKTQNYISETERLAGQLARIFAL